jgi:hypothetical protein
MLIARNQPYLRIVKFCLRKKSFCRPKFLCFVLAVIMGTFLPLTGGKNIIKPGEIYVNGQISQGSTP